MEDTGMFVMPVPIGGVVYEKECPKCAHRVIGYRIGRMMGEDLHGYVKDGYADGGWHIEFVNGCVETSAPVAEIGASIFLTPGEAERAASQEQTGLQDQE